MTTRPARITVRVTPRGGRDAIDGWAGDVLRVRVSAAPADGKANEAVVRLLARALGVPPSDVRLVSGARGRTKVLEVAGLAESEARRRLGAGKA
jgi:uncharacterized protein